MTKERTTFETLSVTAILTTLNCCEGLQSCIERLCGELDIATFNDVVVVDGGSTDGTWEVLEQLAQDHPAVRVFQEPGANISRGRNRAVALARGNVILSLDSGCTMVEGYVGLMTKPFVDDPACDVVGGKTVAVGHGVFEQCVAMLERGTRKDTFNPSSRTIAFRKHVFAAIGGYEESIMAGEDTHFNHKWRQAGCKYVHVPEAMVFWRVRSSLAGLYRMQRRNITGSIAIGNPWCSADWAMRANIISVALSLVSAGIASAGHLWAWYLAVFALAGSSSYVLFRTLRRGRWRFVTNPACLCLAAAAIFAMDLGTWAGTIRGWRQRCQCS